MAWEVEAALRKMKNGKEAGKHQVNIETLKAGDETIAKQLAKLYTKCIKPSTHHAIFVFFWTHRRRKYENRMVWAHQRRSSFVDFTNATVVGPIRKSNRSNCRRMVWAGQRHPSHQPTDQTNHSKAFLWRIADTSSWPIFSENGC